MRGQLAEVREGTSYIGPSDTGWERGAIINHYSDQCWGMCSGSNMTDNNGNLKKQEHWIQDGNGNVTAVFTQQFEYDGLNRLQRVYDGTNWQQPYVYDRWGNRKINDSPQNQGGTYGFGINNKAFTVDTDMTRERANQEQVQQHLPSTTVPVNLISRVCVLWKHWRS